MHRRFCPIRTIVCLFYRPSSNPSPYFALDHSTGFPLFLISDFCFHYRDRKILSLNEALFLRFGLIHYGCLTYF